MDTDHLSTAPRAVRIAIARALVDNVTGDARENHVAGGGAADRLGQVSRQEKEMDAGADHDRTRREFTTTAAASMYATPSAKPVSEPQPMRSKAYATIAPVIMTIAKVVAPRIYAAACEAAWGRTGMSLALRGTRIFFARSSSTATRQRGTKPERFQLCTVVSGMPVPFEMAVTPPSASKMSDTLSMPMNYDNRNSNARA